MSNGPIEFGVGDDRAALEKFKAQYQEPADLADLSLEDMLSVLVVAYDGWLNARLGQFSDIAHQEINSVVGNLLLSLGVPEETLFKPQDESEVDYLVDEALEDEEVRSTGRGKMTATMDVASGFDVT